MLRHVQNISILRSTIKFSLTAVVIISVVILGSAGGYAEQPGSSDAPNILLNGSFEAGNYFPEELPKGWTWEAYKSSADLTWDDTEALDGNKSVKIEAPNSNDASWIQTVTVQPNTLYFLSGWIKTDTVAHSSGSVNAGANLSLYGTWTHSTGVFGTRDWTRSGLLFNSGEKDQVTVAARLGYWSGTATGTAWFDDLKLESIVPMDPHPSWKILVLIYRKTDFEFIDSANKKHHFVATLTQDEMEQAALAAKQFVEIDIPALTSGNMIPEVTVRFPERKLTELSQIGSGWWPAPKDTAQDRDPEFDSVIVIWEPHVTDLETNKAQWIGYADGLTQNMGTGQTYFTMQTDAAIRRGHRNVFKHEWGHSILFYFEAVGTVPSLSVTNHAQVNQYVRCKTGKDYDWQDETLEDPVENSIYNNESGFTHDYYSGTTATADQPDRCLGITPEAWALGGPVSHSGNIDDSVSEIEADLHIFPRVLNLKSRGGKIICWIKLPEEIDPQDIDRSSLELSALANTGFEPIYPIKGFPFCKGYLAFFKRRDLIDEVAAIDLDLPTELDLIIAGKLKDGTLFEGSDSITAFKSKRHRRR